MKQPSITFCQILSGALLLLNLSSCAVKKTPYFKTDYYKNSVTRLDSIKKELITINDSFLAGFAKVNITPDLNNKEVFGEVPLAGFGGRKGKPATGIHDSIYVKAVALKTGNELLVIIGADILIMPPNITDAVAVRLAEKGIRRSQLFFSATHSHSSIGGWGYGWMAKVFSGKENKKIQAWLIQNIEKSVCDAVNNLHPSSIGTGSFNGSNYTRNRLTGNPREKNDDFSFLVLEQTGGERAIIGSFSAHATTQGSKNMEISADYPGYWERKIESTSANVAIFCGGSMGSQSPVGKGEGFEGARHIGESLADSLKVHLKEIKMDRTITTASLSLKMFLPEYHIRLSENKNFTTRFSKRLMPLPENVYLQTLRFNDLLWNFTPGDFSGESALLIKKILAGKGYKGVISGYNGSYVGYIMPGKYFYLNNYEPKTMGWFGPTMGDYTFDLINQMNEAVIENGYK